MSENQEESVEGFARHDDEKGVHGEREEDESGRKEEKGEKGARGDRKKVRTTGYCTKRIRYRARARVCFQKGFRPWHGPPKLSVRKGKRGKREGRDREEGGRRGKGK